MHILPDYRIDLNFTINISTLLPDFDNQRSIVLKLFKRGNLLYAIGGFNDSFSRELTSIVALNASTGMATAFPKSRGISRAVEYGGVLYAVGGNLRDSTDTPYGSNVIAIDLQTRQRRNWTPTVASGQTANGSIVFCAGGKVIVDYLVAGNTPGSYTHMGIAAFDTTNTATLPASWTYQVPYTHSVAISAQGIFVHNQALYLPVWTNNDTYVLQAFNLANGTSLSGWNPDTFTFQNDNGGFVYRSAVTKASVIGNRVYLYGFFNQVNGVSRKNWAAIDLATNQLTNWDLQASSVVGNSTILYAYQNKLFCLARAGDSYYKYTSRPHLALLNPVTQDVIPKTFPFLPNEPTNTWAVNKLATVDNVLWVVQSGQRAPNESIGAYDIPTGDKLNPGTFRFLNQGTLSQSFTKLLPVDTVLYTLGIYESANGQMRPSGMAAISVNGSVLPFTLNADARSITDFAIVGDLLYICGTFTQINGVARKYLASVNRFTGQLTNWNPSPAYPVSTIAISGNNVFISGSQPQIGPYVNPKPNQFTNFLIDRITGSVIHSFGTGELVRSSLAKEQYMFLGWGTTTESPCAALTYFNTERKKYASQCFIKRPQWYTTESALFAGNRLFFYPQPVPGGNPRQSLLQVAFPSTFFNETVDFFPRIGSTKGDVTVNFYGYNLSAGTKVRLLKDGETPIVVPDSSLTYPDNFRVQAVLNLRAKSIGDWDIELTLPNYQKILIRSGFKIKQATAPILNGSIVGPSSVRINQPARYYLTIANRGETDAHGVLVYFAINKETEVTFKFDLIGRTNTPVPSDSLRYFTFDSLQGKPFSGRLYWLMVNVSAETVLSLPIILKPKTTKFNAKMWVGTPVFGSPMTQLSQDCNAALSTAVGKALAGIDPWAPFVGCFNNVSDLLSSIEGSLLSKSTNDKPIAGDYLSSISGAILDCSKSVGLAAGITLALPEGAFVAGVGAAVLAAAGNWIPSLFDTGLNCSGMFPNPKNEREINPAVITSQDPNDKIGPVGVHAQRYITDKDPITYLIRFENYPTATAAAQFVQVLDTLNANKFDFSTFQFGYFNVADTNFYAPPGRKSFLRDWDLRPAKELIVRMEANFNDSTGILKATYTALDPVTMELTEDAILGFLPPNQTAPEGEGSLFFSIQAKPDLPHAATITNRASIVFDYNVPIPTPAWTNTLDKTLPQSTIQPLPSVSSDTTLTLRWDGSDTGAGVRLYDVYVSVNGGTYKPVVTNTSLKEVSYIGKADSTYRFYSVAIDSVGNEEPIPVNFDTQTTIAFGGIRSLASGNWNNPATWSCNCVPGAQDVITIMDGHRVEVPDSQSVRFKKLIVKQNANLYYKRE
ncbi:hypothetical protein GO730_18450 [Spirosoma sp. HMF3257]|uniref:DUF7619 domain-containing protein n=1 Tax=Spirosoma telluris TaxID=2183553 RepID=A0A327NPA4_9BACT|nr:hypothetical protein [Spirosoma telluris]RAI75634.1 hypothetical protein HMF3257_18380 [Spirosoma telluris]